MALFFVIMAMPRNAVFVCVFAGVGVSNTHCPFGLSCTKWPSITLHDDVVCTTENYGFGNKDWLLMYREGFT